MGVVDIFTPAAPMSTFALLSSADQARRDLKASLDVSFLRRDLTILDSTRAYSQKIPFNLHVERVSLDLP